MTTLITGGAGFIGFHVARAYLSEGERVVALDNLNDYYDPTLKKTRLAELERMGNFGFHHADVGDADAVDAVFRKETPTQVLHLAAQAGVRYSLKNPLAYVANMTGLVHVLESCRKHGPGRVVYASSSSVYGRGPDGLPRTGVPRNEVPPSRETDRVDRPISLYAATKVANELIAHSYHEMFGIPSVGLRFFTVYGPWGRPDMAAWTFARAIQEGRPVTLYEDGRLWRDFTYIDDCLAGIRAAMKLETGCQVINLGKGNPDSVRDLVGYLEEALGRKAAIRSEPKPASDVEGTFADIALARRLLGYNPQADLRTGIHRFVKWLNEYSTR